MSGEIDFGSFGLGQFSSLGMGPPPARLEQAAGHPQPSAPAHGTGGADAAAPAGHDLHLSTDLQALCRNLNDAAHARQGRKESVTGSIVKPYTHPNLTQTVKKASRSPDVTRSSPHKQDLRDSFATVHKPVIFLDGDCSVEYVFVHVDGEWRGFDGAFRPLPETHGPVDAMMNICGRSNAGMWFTQYDVKGDFRVIEPRTTRPDDAHEDDGGSSIDFQRELRDGRLSRGASPTGTGTGIDMDEDRSSPALSRSNSHTTTDSTPRGPSGNTSDDDVSPMNSPVLPHRELDHG